jgi:hypothetical protein
MPWLGAVIGGVQATVGQITGAEAAGQQEKAAQRAQAQMLAGIQQQQMQLGANTANQMSLWNGATSQGNAALQQSFGQGMGALGAGYGMGQGQFAQGAGALNQLAAMGPYSAAQMGAGGNVQALMANPNAFQQDPGYQFRLQQGQQAVQASNAAQGGRLSGRALQEMSSFNQGLASQEFGNAFQRAQSADAQIMQAQQFNAMAQNQAMAQAMGLNAQGLQGLGSLYQNQAQFSAQGGQAQANLMAQLGMGMNQNIFAGAQGQAGALQNQMAQQMSLLDMQNMAYGGTVGYAGQGMQAIANGQMAKAEGSFGTTGQTWGA